MIKAVSREIFYYQEEYIYFFIIKNVSMEVSRLCLSAIYLKKHYFHGNN